MTLTRDTHDAPEAQHSDAGTASPHPHLGIALAIICAAQLMVVLDATVVNVALPSIQRQLHFSSVNLEWVITGYALAFGGLLLLGGRLTTLLARQREDFARVVRDPASTIPGHPPAPGADVPKLGCMSVGEPEGKVLLARSRRLLGFF